MSQRTANYRADVSVLFGETNSQLRLGLRQALRTEGYVNIREVTSEGETRLAIQSESPDIAILDGALAGDIISAISDLRHGRYSINPYVPIILTSWYGEVEQIRRMMNSGADEILLKPLSIAMLMERIYSLVSRRKPFLATEDYVGPDRRGGRVDPNAPGVALIHPPNTLKAKLEGTPISREELLDMVHASQVGMQEQRMTRDIARIGNLTRAVESALVDGRRDQKLFSELDQLVFLGRGMKAQVANTPFGEVVPILDRLHKIASDLRDRLPALDERDVKLLPPLADAIHAVIGSPEARRHIAEIISMMKDAKRAEAAAAAAAAAAKPKST